MKILFTLTDTGEDSELVHRGLNSVKMQRYVSLQQNIGKTYLIGWYQMIIGT